MANKGGVMTFEEWLDIGYKDGCTWRQWLSDSERRDMERCWRAADRNAREACIKIVTEFKSPDARLTNELLAKKIAATIKE